MSNIYIYTHISKTYCIYMHSCKLMILRSGIVERLRVLECYVGARSTYRCIFDSIHVPLHVRVDVFVYVYVDMYVNACVHAYVYVCK